MPTTVHLPQTLLASVDRQAKRLGLSRNRYIRRSLEKTLAEETEWSPAFRDMLTEAWEDKESHAAVDEMLATITAHRTSKPPPNL